MMGNVNCAKERVKPLILATPIGLDGDYLAVKHAFHKTLKFLKKIRILQIYDEEGKSK
jgi:hypothetical protein